MPGRGEQRRGEEARMSGEEAKRGRGRPRISPDGVMVTRTVGMTARDWAIVGKAAEEAEESLSAALRRIVSAWEEAAARRALLAREMAELDDVWGYIETKDAKKSGEDFGPI